MSPLITGTTRQGAAWRLLGLATVVVAAILAAWLSQAQAQPATEEATPTPGISEPEPTVTVPPDPEANENEAARRGEARCRRGTVAVPSSPRNSQLGAECRALLALKDELRGRATLNWSVSLSMEQWDGVTVERRRVTKLELPNKRLSGYLPAGLGSLTALRELDLSNNRLRGKVPVELGNLAELRVLKLAGNRLRGCVLPVLAAVATNDLTTAGLSACTHSCETGWAVPRPAATPDLVKDCRVLLGLKDELRGGHPLNWSASRGMNDWDGITVSEGRVTKLEITDRIAMTGTLPVKLGKLKGLRELDLHNSRLQGTVPAELGKLTELIYLDLSKNRLTGQLPPELGNLRKLRTLRLRVNDFTGCVPHGLRYTSHHLDLPWCPAVRKLEKAAGAAASVPYGASVQLDIDVYDAKGTKLADPTKLPAGVTIAWYVGSGQAQANAAVEAERANTATSPAAPLASVAGKPASITYTPPLSVVGKTVTIVAVVDEVSCPGRSSNANASRAAVWNGPCGVAFTLAVKPPAAPELMIITDGADDALILKWTGGPANATKWQYRIRGWGANFQPLAWQAWTDVPDSGPTTRTFRLTGLTALADIGNAYDIEVRAVVGTLEGQASAVGEGTVPKKGVPALIQDMIAMGDGKTVWRVHDMSWGITIPKGKLIRGGGAWVTLPDQITDTDDGDARQVVLTIIHVYDVVTGSQLSFDAQSGREIGRTTPPEESPAPGGDSGDAQQTRGEAGRAGPPEESPTPGGDSGDREGEAHDVDDLFDQIVASVKEID